VLAVVEREGLAQVVPCARAAKLTMNREGIRRLAAEELGLLTSPYAFAEDHAAYLAAIEAIGFPCVVKPIMSSSGKGQMVVTDRESAERAYRYANEHGRNRSSKVIVEGFVAFDYEITLLTVRHVDGTSYCAPIGHRQEHGDYRESWQPQPMSEVARQEAERMAKSITDALGGRGLFGVEFFVKGDQVIFSEVSPRPHDTGMVTLISQDLSEFALHVRAILGLPIGAIRQHGPSASAVILGEGNSTALSYEIDPAALAEPDTSLRLFGKPELKGERRLGVALARAETTDAARSKALQVARAVRVVL
jgi:phosphoribosylglycinamide formyltransferase 2